MEMPIFIKRHSEKPLYIQIYECYKKAILEGTLKKGDRLESIMQLKNRLCISRNTVQGAYDQLLCEGYIYSKNGSGYYVEAIEDQIKTVKKESIPLKLKPLNSIHIDDKVYPYNFKPGSVDQESFPFVAWRKIEQSFMKKENIDILTYSDPRGEFELRSQIASYVKSSRGVICSPDQIIIGAGTQTLMAVLCDLFSESCNKNIAFEEPGFSAVRKVFEWYGYNIEPIELTQVGMSIEKLETLRVAPEFIYVTPSNQHPLGMSMPVSNRIKLLNFISKGRGYIIEDDYDSEFRYNVNPIPSLQSLDSEDRVIYLGTFSKTLFPGMHVGYMILPENIMNLFIEKGSFINQTASKIHQLTIAEFMKEGLFETHLRKMRNIYAKKQQFLIDCIKQQFGEDVVIYGERAGVNITLQVKNNLNELELINRALENGVKVYPISFYYFDQGNYKEGNMVFMGYGHLSFHNMQNGIKLLKKAWF
ncbi:PLP-dependent aminotransferase family protein [Clostridium coskatii]|uniref:HTH-type transcriptional regulatory protein GabR n=1 Tax=Clostridium coskatii TaxID=1705578 RepID=A0A168QA14_9CLOT|nr:PLP-dependent aminotransferase family protein [Clostridium coskatii]OAA88827.1 HTH-type transcriptional regulatory protein GabR [Clostridium coskatii]OBR93590.1 HTH-type transcriptional regulatory protein GabR [Clostridium coskatii]